MDIGCHPMELHFHVTPAHTQARLVEKLAQQTQAHDRRIAAVEGWQQRVLAPLRRVLPTWLIGTGAPRNPQQRLNHRLIEARLRQTLKAAEGQYCLAFDEQGFRLRRDNGAPQGLAWEQITCVRESADFYAVSDARLERKQLAYRIARHSDLMPADTYQQGLQAFLAKCPVAPQPH